MDSKIILIALNQFSGIGPKTIGRLLNYWPNLGDLIQEHQRGKLRRRLPEALHHALGQLNWKQAEQELKWSTQEACRIITIMDPDYPLLLQQISDPPPVLYVQGHLDDFNRRSLAVVGSRHPSAYGERLAYDWCRGLAQAGLVLVSGMAIGIDTWVHKACIDAHQITIAVLGSGLQKIYPKQNIALAERIGEKGAVISEFSLKTPPNPRHFPSRNRIISGLALSTLVVEATEKSGTLITAQHAVEQNRDVYVIPGRVDLPYQRGGHLLIQQGAKLITQYQDILVDYA